MIGTLVDDTFGIGNASFADEEERKSRLFDVKERESLPFRCNCCDASADGVKIKLHQTEYTTSLKKLSPSRFMDKEFCHLRGQLACIATSSRPDTAFANAQLAQVEPVDATPSHVRTLNSTVSHLTLHRRGIYFPKLDMDTLPVRGYADASFANNTDNLVCVSFWLTVKGTCFSSTTRPQRAVVSLDPY